MKRFFASLLSLGLLLYCAAPSSALQLPEGVEEQISIDISPRNPGPNETVTITVRSFSTNIGGASIAWFLNGELIVNERGATTFTTRTGDVGTQTEVLVRITKAEGGEIARIVNFAPADLELVFEPQTFTPPFYKGRSVYTHQAPYKVIALPRFIGLDGTRYSERDLIYTWRINGRYVEGAGGIGGNILQAKGQLVSRPFDVSVEVQSPDGTIGAKETLYVTPSSPDLVLYENSPLYGVLYNNAVDENLSLSTNKELSVTAIPYFFGINDPESDTMTYNWNIDERIVIMASNENDLTVRVPEGENLAGTNRVYVEARNALDVLQSDYAETFMEFGDVNL